RSATLVGTMVAKAAPARWIASSVTTAATGWGVGLNSATTGSTSLRTRFRARQGAPQVACYPRFAVTVSYKWRRSAIWGRGTWAATEAVREIVHLDRDVGTASSMLVETGFATTATSTIATVVPRAAGRGSACAERRSGQQPIGQAAPARPCTF